MDRFHTYKEFETGSVIMTQGEVGTCAYLIEEGHVEILISKADGSQARLATRGPGTIIGEMALVDNAPRTATVKAVSACKLLEITRADFERRLNSADPVIKMISQIILTRYRDMLTRASIFNDPGSVRTPEDFERQVVEQHNASELIKIANEFKTAIEAGQLQLHYQPIIDLQTADLKGFEALMRWNHPDKGMISPGVFIPVAEDSGLIVDASRWALREACEALSRIQGNTGYDTRLSMSVNFSSTDFAEESFVDQVYMTLSETDIPPQYVHLEITERLLMNQPENAKETLTMCRNAGLGISIDDFGTGYSSLSYLHYYPIDTLKIDQSFIRGMQKDETSKELVKSIIALGQNMKMKTIAEGVEDAADATLLKNMGCDECQGFYFSKPLPEHDVIKFVRDWDANPLRESF